MSYAIRKALDLVGLFLFLAIMVFAFTVGEHEAAFGALCAVAAFAVSILATLKLEAGDRDFDFGAYRLACLILGFLAVLAFVYSFMQWVAA